MMKANDLVIVEPIIETMVQKIVSESNIPPLEAMDLFYHSQTYEMLTDSDLYLWDLSDKALYDLWLTEQETGNPRNSIYL
jgi:hypothetical protein